MDAVKVYGIQRSGTNFAEFMIRQMFDCPVLDWETGGWKHGPISCDCLALVMVKHPLPWLLSIRGFRNKKRLSLRDYVFQTEEIEVWNAHYQERLLELETKPKIGLCRYEETLSDPVGWFEEWGVFHGLPRKDTEVQVPTKSMDKYAAPGAKGFNPRTYLGKTWKAVYTPDLVDEVERRVDPGVLEALGLRPVRQEFEE